MSGAPTSHTLYRFFDMRGALLYVGRTIAPARRWREHEKNKAWFNDVAKVTREVFATAAEVDRAERDAIVGEAPMYNIALTGRPRPIKPAVAPLATPEPGDDEWPADLRARWEAAQVEPVAECEGDLTFCECSSCHDYRMILVDELRDTVGIHPETCVEIEQLEHSYFDGDDLAEWYYDAQDIKLFGRWKLARLSRDHAYPAYTQIEPGPVAVVWCPFCSDQHRHLLAPNALLDAPLVAGCKPSPDGRYLLITDLAEQFDLERRWGSRYDAQQVTA